tara:strand:- start:201 stop:872 length:672 start_codon:yes stop_codon:yes gene_type:complete
MIIALPSSIFAIGGLGLSVNSSTFSVEAASSDLMVENVKVGSFSYEGFENGGGLGGYLYLDIIPIVDLDIEYNFTAQVYDFTFKNEALVAPVTEEFAFASGSMFITLQKSVFDLGIPFLAKARLYGGLGMNQNASTPMVNQEMLESVFGGATELENGEYDYTAVTDYLAENVVETTGFHIDAGVFFKVLTFSGAVYYRQVISEDVIPGNNGFSSLNFRLGLGI